MGEMKDWQKLVSSIVGCELVGIAGGVLTAPAIPTWYVTLNKPAFAPPNWLFGPAWTLLYLMMGIAFYLIWRQGWKKKKNREAGRYFGWQLLLNSLWSPVFFGLRSPELALFLIVIMWGMIVVTIKKFYPLSRAAGYLLLPYLLWVSFATLLNAGIVVLN